MYKRQVIVGTTGESATVDVSEHVQLIERAVQHSDGRIEIIAGTGANSTKEALFLTESAKKVGASAALLVTPYYNRPTQKGLLEHYKLIANEVDLAIATIVSCSIFAAISGSSVATAATISTVAFPAMINRGYHRNFTLGILAAGGTLGILIPPSIPMIVYAFVVEESVLSMFLAGIGQEFFGDFFLFFFKFFM